MSVYQGNDLLNSTSLEKVQLENGKNIETALSFWCQVQVTCGMEETLYICLEV